MVICVGSVCAFATFSAIVGCIIIASCRRQRLTKFSKRNKKIKRCNDKQDKGSDDETSECKNNKQNKCESYHNLDSSSQRKKSRQKQDGDRNGGDKDKGKTKSASAKNSSMRKRVCTNDNSRSYVVERDEEDKQTWGIYEEKINTSHHNLGNEENRVNHGKSCFERVIDKATDILDKDVKDIDRDRLKTTSGRKKYPSTDPQAGERVGPCYNDSHLSATSAIKCYKSTPSISVDTTLRGSLNEVVGADIKCGSSMDGKSLQSKTRPMNRRHSSEKSNSLGTGEYKAKCSSLAKKISPAAMADYAKGWGYSHFDVKTNKAVVKSYPSDVESPNSFMHLVGYSNDSKCASKTVKGSVYGLVTEDMRSAQIVRQKSSPGFVMESEIKKKSRNARRVKLGQEDTTNVVKAPKNAKENKIGVGGGNKGTTSSSYYVSKVLV